jgi:hypothetical protein
VLIDVLEPDWGMPAAVETVTRLIDVARRTCLRRLRRSSARRARGEMARGTMRGHRSRRMVTHTYSGGRDQTAVIGHAPEDRNWKPGDRAHKPFIGSGARIEAYVTVDAGTKRATHIGRGRG